ncbi:MAG: hypothetical protein Q4Q17_01555 [Tissierellia bacterium]|nr:hypothetical protein [Tissierellia bacterium]
MENNRNKVAVVILSVLVIVALVLLALRYYGTRDREDNILFPKLDEKAIEEIESGHHTGYFNSDDVLFTYLSNTYPNRTFQVEEVKEEEGVKHYRVSLEGRDSKETFVLREVAVDKDGEIKIWAVIEDPIQK